MGWMARDVPGACYHDRVPPQHEQYVGLLEEVRPPSCCGYGCTWQPGARAFPSILPRTPGALPQTGAVGANNSLSSLRQLAHCAFLDTLVSSNSKQEHDAKIEMLKAGRALGPAGRRRLLCQFNEAGVPLFPLQPPKGPEW